MGRAADMPPIPGTEKLAEEDDGKEKPSLAKLLGRMNDCTKTSDATLSTSKLAKDKATKKAAAKQKLEASNKLFDTYDGDRDGILNKKDVLKYAKSEFQFAVPSLAIDEMWKA